VSNGSYRHGFHFDSGLVICEKAYYYISYYLANMQEGQMTKAQLKEVQRRARERVRKMLRLKKHTP